VNVLDGVRTAEHLLSLERILAAFYLERTSIGAFDDDSLFGPEIEAESDGECSIVEARTKRMLRAYAKHWSLPTTKPVEKLAYTLGIVADDIEAGRIGATTAAYVLRCVASEAPFTMKKRDRIAELASTPDDDGIDPVEFEQEDVEGPL